VLGGVLLALDVLAERARALDRRRPDRGRGGEEELGRGGDDRPAVAGERPRRERRERAASAPRVAANGAAECWTRLTW
jgi:hypothetical protein